MPVFDQTILIQNINNLMKENNVKQQQLADDLHIGQPSINKCLNGKQSISIELVYQIAHRFNVSIDYLCCDHATDSNKPQKDSSAPKYDSPAQILVTVCTALATIFKTSTPRTNEFDVREEMYVEATDDYGNEIGSFYRKTDGFNMDPVNKYISLYFPNYDKVQNSFNSQSDANEYYCLLQEYGNALETNMRINEFLRQLTDLQTVYLKNSMSTESYYKAIDDNLAALKEIWDKP